MQHLSRPLAPTLAVFCFRIPEPSSPAQRTRTCKINNIVSIYGETFYGRHTARRQDSRCCDRLIRKGSFGNTVNLHVRKQQDSIWFSLFMRDNGKWRPLVSSLAVFRFRMSEPNSPKRPENVKITTLYLCAGRRFTAITRHNDSCCDLLINWNGIIRKYSEPTS